MKLKDAASAAGVVLSIALLAGCSGGAQSSSTVQPTPTPTVEENRDGVITGKVAELEPGTEVPSKPLTELKDLPPTAKPTTPPVPKDAAPERPGTETGVLPANFEIPEGATLFEEASVVRGDRSFLALEFDVPWQEAATLLKESLKAEGWVCTNCIDYPASYRSKDEQDWRYLLTMEREGRKLNGVIVEFGKKSGASLNFVP